MESSRYLFITEPSDATENDGHPVLWRQFFQSAFYHVMQLLLCYLAARAYRRAHHENVLVEFLTGVPIPITHDSDTDIGRDLTKPRFHRGNISKRVKLVPRLKHGLLRSIFREFSIPPDSTLAQLQNTPIMNVDFLEKFTFTHRPLFTFSIPIHQKTPLLVPILAPLRYFVQYGIMIGM